MMYIQNYSAWTFSKKNLFNRLITEIYKSDFFVNISITFLPKKQKKEIDLGRFELPNLDHAKRFDHALPVEL
jgi:hypothetical protein